MCSGKWHGPAPEIKLAWHSFCPQNRLDVCQQFALACAVPYPAKDTLPREALRCQVYSWWVKSTEGALASTQFSVPREYVIVQCKPKIKLPKATELYLCKTRGKEMQVISWGSILNRAWAALATGLRVSRALLHVLGQGSEVSIPANGHMVFSILFPTVCLWSWQLLHRNHLILLLFLRSIITLPILRILSSQF